MPFPDDEKTNIEFVLALEEIPILYNYKLKEYSNRNEQDKAWRNLSSKFNATDAECRLRWKTIRGGFTRYLKSKNKTGSGAKKPYYLWDQMQFLLPYTRSKSQSGNLGLNQLSQQEDAEDGIEELGDDVEPQQLDPSPKQQTATPTVSTGDSSQTPPLTTPSSSLSAWRSSKFKIAKKKEDSLEKAVSTYLDKKSTKYDREDTSSADLDFFKSILPDIKGFTPQTKRRLKRKVLELIDELAEEDLASSSRSSSSNTITRTISPRANTPSETVEGNYPIGFMDTPRNFNRSETTSPEPVTTMSNRNSTNPMNFPTAATQPHPGTLRNEFPTPASQNFNNIQVYDEPDGSTSSYFTWDHRRPKN